MNLAMNEDYSQFDALYAEIDRIAVSLSGKANQAVAANTEASESAAKAGSYVTVQTALPNSATLARKERRRFCDYLMHTLSATVGMGTFYWPTVQVSIAQEGDTTYVVMSARPH